VEILYLLIPLSVALVFFIGAAFWWFLRSGQFDDLEGPAYRILMDRDAAARTSMDDGEVSKNPTNEIPKEAGSRNDNITKIQKDRENAPDRIE